MGSGQNALQIGPVNAEIGRAELPDVSAVMAHGKGRDPRVGSPAAIDQLRRLRRDGRQGIEAAQPLQLAGSIRGQCDGRADLGQLRGLLENVGFNAPLTQGEGKCQSPNSCADDGNARSFFH